MQWGSVYFPQAGKITKSEHTKSWQEESHSNVERKLSTTALKKSLVKTTGIGHIQTLDWKY